MKFSSVFFHNFCIFRWHVETLFYIIFFCKHILMQILFPSNFFYLDYFRLVSLSLTFRLKFYQIRKFSQIRKFPFEWKPCQQGQYRSVCYNKEDVTINNMLRFFDYF